MFKGKGVYFCIALLLGNEIQLSADMSGRRKEYDGELS